MPSWLTPANVLAATACLLSLVTLLVVFWTKAQPNVVRPAWLTWANIGGWVKTWGPWFISVAALAVALGCRLPTPTPPGPTPPPPAPSPLVQALQVGYTQDIDSNKADLLAKLTSLYRQAPTVANDPSVATIGALNDQLHAAAKALLGDGLANTRKAANSYLDGVLPTDRKTALDASTRQKAATEFGNVAQALQEVHS